MEKVQTWREGQLAAGRWDPREDRMQAGPSPSFPALLLFIFLHHTHHLQIHCTIDGIDFSYYLHSSNDFQLLEGWDSVSFVHFWVPRA